MNRTSLVARGVAATFATQIISWILTFAVMLYVPRYLGAAGLGKLATAISFVTVFGVIVPLGTSNVLIRDIARDRNRTGELLLSALILRLIASKGLKRRLADMYEVEDDEEVTKDSSG